MGATVLQLICS